MEHQHKYDDQGRQLCCTHTEKIYENANKLNHQQHHHDEDGHNHDHNHEGGETIKLFILPIISFVLLMTAIALDHWVPQHWFNGWFRLIWYIAAYLPVGIPVLKDALYGISKGDVFSEFLLMGIATIGAFSIGQYPEGVAVMLFYAIGEVF